MLQILLPLEAKPTTSNDNQVPFGSTNERNSIENRFHILSTSATSTARADESTINFETPTQEGPNNPVVFPDDDVSSGGGDAVLSDDTIGEHIELCLFIYVSGRTYRNTPNNW